MNIEIPPRAEFLRAFWGELSRIHSHTMWLGLAADAIGFESLFMLSWQLRERVLNIIEETAGGRVIFGSCKVGGVRKDITADKLKAIQQELESIRKEYKSLAHVFLNDYTIASRWSDVGNVTKEEAYQLGAVGPTARGSGLTQDMRLLKYGAYEQLDIEPIVETGGDCYARAVVRIKEVYQSFDLLTQIIQKMPAGDIDVKVKGNPDGEYFSRVEQPRGEVIYYIKGNGTKFLDRFRVRTPTFANLAPLLKMLEGCDLADAPAIILSIDPCISCTER
jgi:ech hydrogenase subunit E